MRNQVLHLGAALAIAALAVGCSESPTDVPTERADQRVAGAGQNVKLDGCVANASTNPGQYVLQDVYVPPPATQPLNQNTANNQPLIPNGTWVRLSGGADALNVGQYLGKRVEVIGKIDSMGENTLGTSGHKGTNEEKFKRSSGDAGTNPVRNIDPTVAAPAGADANGLAPSIAIEHIKTLDRPCGAEAEK